MDTEHLGQVFTPQSIVFRMLGLRQRLGTVLEPSVGDGAFWQHLRGEDAVGIEVDPRYCPSDCLNMDFFDYDVSHRFNTIIANPPYVAGKNVCVSTRAKLTKLFPFKTNLYIHFIAKCLAHLNRHGELIFITPRDFIKLTLAAPVNNLMASTGYITHWLEFGEDNPFTGPTAHNLVIWRFEKDYTGHKLTFVNDSIRRMVNSNGQLMFVSADYSVPFSELFYVKVGAVSGADKVFVDEKGNLDIVYSRTARTGKTRKVYYDHFDDHLLESKERLKARRIRKFNDDNWFRWGRSLCSDDADRIYVNCKTRSSRPFFLHPCKNFDGAVLAVFPKKRMNLRKACEMLNDVDWHDLGFGYGGRFIFNQRSLENSLLPADLAAGVLNG